MPPQVYISPTGRRVSVDAKDTELYERLNYRPETVEEASAQAGEQAREDYYSSAEQAASAMVEGVYSGATAGLYDIVQGPDSETARRAQYNPGKRLAAEIAGGLVGTALPIGKGISAMTKAGPAAGFVGRAAGTAAEGAIYGMAASAAQARLADDPLTIETLIHGATAGGFMGLGAHIIAAGVERAAKRASGRLADRAVASLEHEGKVAEVQAKVEAAQRKLKEPAPTGAVGHSDDLRPHWDGFRNAARDAADDLHFQAEQADEAIKFAQEQGTFASAADEALARDTRFGPKEPLTGLEANRISRESLSGPQPDYLPVTRKPTAEMVTSTENPQGWVPHAVRQVAKQADAAMAAAMKGGDIAAAGKAASDYFKIMERAKLPLPEAGWASMGEEGVKMALDAYDQARTAKEVADVLRRMPADLSRMSRTQADVLSAAVEKAGTISSQGKALAESLDNFMANTGVIADGSRAENLYASVEAHRNRRASVPKDRAAAKAEYNAWKDRRRTAAEELKAARKELDDLEQPEVAETKKKAGKSVIERLGGYMTTGLGARVGGKYLGGGMLGRGAGALLATGITKGQGLLGSVLSARARMTSALDAGLARWGSMAGQSMRRGVPGYAAVLRHTTLSGEPDPTPGSVQELAKRRAAELDDVMPRLPDRAYAAMSWMEDEHPEAAAAAQKWFVTAITYLQSVAPKNPGTVWVGGKDRWLPSDLKSREFADRWFGTFMPAEAGMAFLRGEASAATVQALANTNPGIYGYFRQRMLATLADPRVQAKLTREQRAQASWFTGVPMDSLDERHSVEFFQQQFANAHASTSVPPVASPNQGGRPPGPAADQTQAQKLTYR